MLKRVQVFPIHVSTDSTEIKFKIYTTINTLKSNPLRVIPQFNTLSITIT